MTPLLAQLFDVMVADIEQIASLAGLRYVSRRTEINLVGGFYRYFAALVDGMKAAAERDEGLYEHHWEDEEAPEKKSSDTVAPEYRGRVFFLTDSACGRW